MTKKSFTLIELVITIVVLAVMGWMGISAMLSGVDSWLYFTQRKELLVNGRMALDRASREIRMVKNATSVLTANSTTFRFIDLYDKDITYTISSDVINRTEDSFTNGLLSNVTNLIFTYYDSNNSIIGSPVVFPSQTNIRRVRIAMSLLKGDSQTLNLQTDVWPRNL